MEKLQATQSSIQSSRSQQPLYPLITHTDQVISEALDYWSTLARLNWRLVFCDENCLIRLHNNRSIILITQVSMGDA